MNRNTVRLAAAALAVAVSVSELTAIAQLADYLPPAEGAVVQLPTVTITPDRASSEVDEARGQRSALATPLPPR